MKKAAWDLMDRFCPKGWQYQTDSGRPGILEIDILSTNELRHDEWSKLYDELEKLRPIGTVIEIWVLASPQGLKWKVETLPRQPLNWPEATKIETARIMAEEIPGMVTEAWEQTKRQHRKYACEMIPTVWDDDDYPTAGQMTGGMHQPVAPAAPPEKKPEPLPSFHNRPRVYKRDGTFEEK